MNKTIAILFLLVAFSCTTEVKQGAFGYWEGPHPFDSAMKFVIQIESQKDSVVSKGYWVRDGFYQASFEVDSIDVSDDNLVFRIPSWGCNYAGKVDKTSNIVIGGFYCEGEPFDSVKLAKNNSYGSYLTIAKKEMQNADYKYIRSIPIKKKDGFEVQEKITEEDSSFIYGLLPEIINGKYGRINSFLFLRNDKLICEEYFYGYTVNTLHQLESSTKSITSILIGIAKDQGYITDIDEPVCKIFPEFKHLETNNYKKITLRHLLTMTAGFEINDAELFQHNNRIEYALERPLVNQPGMKFQYDGGCTEILGAIIKKKTGKYADEFAKKHLFSPLVIHNYDWNENKNGDYPCMAGSLQLLPRDMVKIGMLVKDNGKWQGKQIVSEDWKEESTAPHIETHIDSDKYGYQWWNIKFESSQKSYQVIWANGLGSQFIFIIPELDIVIVTTGHNYEHNNSWDIIEGIKTHINHFD